MQSDEYDEGYFKETRDNVGLLLKTICPLWRLWRDNQRIVTHDSSMDTNSIERGDDQR